MKRIALVTLLGVLSLAGIGPWIIYAIVLSNLEGRPSLPKASAISKSDAQRAWSDARESGEIRVFQLTPWQYAEMIILGENKILPGERTAWIVARDYGTPSSKGGGGSLEWQLSKAALVVWLTRNWTAEQLVAKSFEIQEEKRRLRREKLQ